MKRLFWGGKWHLQTVLVGDVPTIRVPTAAGFDLYELRKLKSWTIDPSDKNYSITATGHAFVLNSIDLTGRPSAVCNEIMSEMVRRQLVTVERLFTPHHNP